MLSLLRIIPRRLATAPVAPGGHGPCQLTEDPLLGRHRLAVQPTRIGCWFGGAAGDVDGDGYLPNELGDLGW